MILWALIALLAGLFLVGIGLHARWLNQVLRSLPLSKIGSVAGGAVEIQGKAAPVEAHFSPIQQRPCVYWHYRVEAYSHPTGGSHAWKTIDEGRSPSPFYVQDETGKILVDPRGAELEIPMRLFVDSNTKQGAHRECAAYAQSRGWIPKGEGFTRRFRFAEWTLEPDDPVFVLGTAASLTGALAKTAPEAKKVIGFGSILYYLYIGEKSRRELIRRARKHAWAGLVFGAGLLAIGVALMLRAFR